MYNLKMISWFKKHFIPHEGNNHRPHFLRKENTRNVILVVLFLEIFTFVIPTLSHLNINGGRATVVTAVLTDLTNEERQSQNLATLTTNPTLSKAAEMKAEDMATKGYFAHTSPEGKTPWYWLDLVGYKYQYAGENLAIDFTDSKDVTNAWMNSPSHRANIVKDKYTEVGTGMATGIYEGKETVFVAQVYANPIPKEVEPIKVAVDKKEIKEVASDKEIKKDEVNVLGAETVIPTEKVDTQSKEESTFIQKTVASPRNSTNIIFFIISGVIILSLILNIFIKIKHHHTDLITNGLITLAIIVAILVANYYITHKNMVTTQSLDYSSEESL